MKRFIFVILITIFVITSCTNKVEEKVMINTVETKEVEKPFANPAFIYGSDFMSFMQSLKKVGDYSTMLKFTSSTSIEKFGKEKITTFYNENFANMSTLKLKSVIDNVDGTKTMNYVNESFATKSFASVTVLIENDSCKLVLVGYDLNKQQLLN